MSKKDDKIRLLEEELAQYRYEVAFLDERISKLVEERNRAVTPAPKKKVYAATVAFDLWPIKDWYRFSVKPWNPGKYFQLCVGPIRLDFWQD